MDLGRRRTRSSTVVASGSVVKLDGVKVVNGGNEEMGLISGGSSVRKSPIGVVGKRRTWKSEVGSVQISKLRSGLVSDAEMSPIQGRRRLRSERSLSLSGSVDGGGGGSGGGGGGIESPIGVTRKLRSESVGLRPSGESRRVNSVSDEGDGTGTGNDSLCSVQLEPPKPSPEPEPEPVPVPEEERIEVVDELEKTQVGFGVEEDMEFGLCQEKAIPSPSNNVNTQEQENGGDGGDGGDESDDNDEEDIELEGDEFEAMKEEEEEEEEMEVEVEKKSIDIKEMNVQLEPKKVVLEEEEEPKKVVVMEEIKKIQQLNTKPVTMASTVKRQAPRPPSPVIRRSAMYQNLHPPSKPRVSDQAKRFPQTQSKLQSLVDLVMWRDVSRSAFIFGIGTFVIVSSSYTQDLNISFISVISYLGLVYLATIFLYKSIICRGAIDTDDSSYVVGEGEAVWLLKLILPYLNEFLLKLRALFSGDPPTTMKLAVLLFVLARCGSSITIWKMAKFGFFGVFTVPKICSSYSTQITAYGKFWIRRFGDAWESCTHKKAVAFAIFTLVWNLSSIVARIWAVFMVFVGMRYYQQSMMVRSDDWVEVTDEEEEEEEEETWQQGHGNGPATTINVGLNKTKKRS